MSDERQVTPNPKRWREMQEPHENVTALNAALDAFHKGVEALREEHRIADVLVSVRVRCLSEDGDEREATMCFFYGDSTHEEGIAAYAYGVASSARQQTISDLISAKAIKSKR